MSPLLILASVLVFLSLVYLLAGTRFVPNDRVGIVEKRFGGDGERRSLIALGNEPGFRPDGESMATTVPKVTPSAPSPGIPMVRTAKSSWTG